MTESNPHRNEQDSNQDSDMLYNNSKNNFNASRATLQRLKLQYETAKEKHKATKSACA